MDLKEMMGLMSKVNKGNKDDKSVKEASKNLKEEIMSNLSKNSDGEWVYDSNGESSSESDCEECDDCKCSSEGANNKNSVCGGVKEIDKDFGKTIDDLKENMNTELKSLKKLVNTTRKIEITTAKGKKVKLDDELVHEKFPLVLSYLTQSKPVLVYGETGSGKTHMARQIAKANEWDYYFCNQVTEEYKLTGFIDARGKYNSTPFFDAFTKGGLFCIDEIDASIPEVIICLNMALANGQFNFPHGMFDMHDDFRLIACANTIGGATSSYTGRSKLDKATLDRFVIIKMDYDNGLESKLMSNETLELINALRRYVTTEKRIDISFSTRCGIYYDEMKKAGLSYADLIENILLRGVDIQDFESFGYSSDNDEIRKVRDGIQGLI